MRFLKRLSLYIAFIMCTFSAFPQSGSADYEFIWHSADNNSLPQNSIKSITQDKYGFIWLSTENGLVRYDGYHFKVFGIDNKIGINSNRIHSFRGSVEKDSIYVQNDAYDYILIKKNYPAIIPKDRIPEHFRISNIFTDGTRNYINKIHNVNNSYYTFNGNKISSYTIKNKLLWQAEYDATNVSFFVFDDKLYAFNGNECLRFDKGRIFIENIAGLPDKTAKIFTNNVSHQAFFQIGSNLYLLEKRGGKLSLKIVLKNYDFSKNNIISAYFDHQNEILYLGSSTRGLLIVKKKLFEIVLGKNDNGVYYAQFPYGSDRFLTASGEVFTASGVLEKIVFKSPNDKYSLLIDKQGDIWTKAHNVVYRLHKKSNFSSFDKWVFADRVTQLFEMKNGKILVGMSIVGSPKGKIYQLNTSEKKLSFIFHMNVDFNATYMVQVEDNILWTGSHLGLYKIYFKEKKAIAITGISNTYVRSVYAKNPRQIWATTYDKGFFLYEPLSNKTTHFPVDKNKYLLSSHCIVEDHNGFFWISSNKGLFQVSKKNLLEYANNKTKNVYYHYYDKSDGFATNEFNGGCQPCGLFLKNYYVTFPSMRGHVMFNSNKVKMLFPTSDIFFEEAEVDNKKATIIGNQLTLDQGFGRLKLSIQSPYFGNPNNLNIETKFDGPVSQKWTRLSEDDISFTALPPGTYYLTARKLTGFNSQYKYKKLIIIIEPAFYQTLWFKLICVGLGIFFIVYFIKIRIRYIRRKNILLEKKVAEQTFQLQNTISTLRRTKENLSKEIRNHKKLIATITHDIKSPLRFLALTGQHAYQNIDEESVLDDLKSIYTSSFQLYHFVDNLLEYAKVAEEEASSEPYELRLLVEEKVQIFLNLASSQKTEIVNKISPNNNITTNRLLLSIIIHNLLDNAVKNTFNGKISFTSGKEKEKTFLKIKDTGNGMSPELIGFYTDLFDNKVPENSQKIGMGLQMIVELLIILDGNIKIASPPNGGTEITIWFKNTAKPN